MEYTDYYVARGTDEEVSERLRAIVSDALVIDGLECGYVPFVAMVSRERFDRWDWLLRIYDAEGGAWGFVLYLAGVELGSGEWGENAEWGIEEADNGFEGDLETVAAALGTAPAELSKCFDLDGVERFCKAIGFVHQYCLFAQEMPPGVNFVSTLG